VEGGIWKQHLRHIAAQCGDDCRRRCWLQSAGNLWNANRRHPCVGGGYVAKWQKKGWLHSPSVSRRKISVTRTRCRCLSMGTNGASLLVGHGNKMRRGNQDCNLGSSPNAPGGSPLTFYCSYRNPTLA